MTWFRVDAHPAEQQLSAYLDRELAEREAQRLAEHVDGCERCASLLIELGSVKMLVGTLPAIQPSRSFVLGRQHAVASGPAPASTPRRRFVLAPALALTILVSLLAIDFADFSGSGGDAGTASLSKASDAAQTGSPVPSLPEAAFSTGAEPSANRPELRAAGEVAVPTAVPPGGLDYGGQRDESQAPEEAPAPVAATQQDDNGSGISLLRVLEVLAGIAFVGSVAMVLWSRMGWVGGNRG
jgi:anti-sigma factor RsiW